MTMTDLERRVARLERRVAAGERWQTRICSAAAILAALLGVGCAIASRLQLLE